MYLLLRGRVFSPSFFFCDMGRKGDITYALIFEGTSEMAQPGKGFAFKTDALSLIPGPT